MPDGEGTCPYHGTLMATLGEIKGKQDLMIDQQRETTRAIFAKLDGLSSNGTAEKVHMAEEHSEIMLDRQKMKPVFWIFISVGSGFILAVTDVIVRHFWK